MGRLIAIPLLGSVAVLSFGLLLLGYEVNTDLKAKLEEANFIMEAQRQEYENRIKALNAALKERGRINESFCQNRNDLQEALRLDPHADMPVSEAIRMRLQWREYENSESESAE